MQFHSTIKKIFPRGVWYLSPPPPPWSRQRSLSHDFTTTSFFAPCICLLSLFPLNSDSLSFSGHLTQDSHELRFLQPLINYPTGQKEYACKPTKLNQHRLSQHSFSVINYVITLIVNILLSRGTYHNPVGWHTYLPRKKV